MNGSRDRSELKQEEEGCGAAEDAVEMQWKAERAGQQSVEKGRDMVGERRDNNVR